jgi:hypothetical protein
MSLQRPVGQAVTESLFSKQREVYPVHTIQLIQVSSVTNDSTLYTPITGEQIPVAEVRASYTQATTAADNIIDGTGLPSQMIRW